MERFQGYCEDEWISIRKALLNPRQVEVEGNSIVIQPNNSHWLWGEGVGEVFLDKLLILL